MFRTMGLCRSRGFLLSCRRVYTWVSHCRYNASIYEGREGSGVLSALHPLYKAFVFFLKVCATYSCTVLLLWDSTRDAAIQAVKLNSYASMCSLLCHHHLYTIFRIVAWVCWCVSKHLLAPLLILAGHFILSCPGTDWRCPSIGLFVDETCVVWKISITAALP